MYRDDGLAISHSTPRQTELIKKEICAIFARNNLKITIEANKKTVDFLDITLDLTTGTYKPFMIPYNTLLYVHKDSNHPPSITKNIPESINKRLSNISSNESIFDEAAPPYQEALKKSGYSWFNPPYSKNVATNIGKKFFHLLDKCFPPANKLHRLLNRNTIKLSCSCMPNVHNIISRHNKSTLAKTEPKPDDNARTCNCRDSDECPVENKCLTKGVVYQATVTRQDNMKNETYIGLTENSFKTRFSAHKYTFNHEECRHATTLSEHVWSLTDKKVKFSMKCRIVSKAKPYSTAIRNAIYVRRRNSSLFTNHTKGMNLHRLVAIEGNTYFPWANHEQLHAPVSNWPSC